MKNELTAIEDMTIEQRLIFDMYCDLECALINEYEIMESDNVSEHLKESVAKWSTRVYELGLIDAYLHGQAQKMAAGDGSWINS